MSEPELSEIVPIPCRICKQPVATVLPPDDSPFRASLERVARSPLGVVHNACLDSQKAIAVAADILARENARLCSWRTLCPPEFQKPIDWKYRSANRTNLNKILAWTFGEQGLLVNGGNGLCKTRFVWRLLEREWNAGRTIAAHTHGHLRQTISTLMASDQVRALSFVESVSKVEILFIDDLGKGRPTPASEEAFFDVLDFRMRNCRPTLFTTNLSVEALDQHFSEAFAGSLQRRIIDRCQLLEF